MVHLYWGEGKGKTTAAMGLALRMLGAGGSVVIVQFLKNGDSSELVPLIRLGAVVLSGKPSDKFTSRMSQEEKTLTRVQQTENLRRALDLRCDLLVLDEACAAWQLDMVDQDMLKSAVTDRPRNQEVVMTGRDPAPWMQELADYSTQMNCVRHPYRQGVAARPGIEF